MYLPRYCLVALGILELALASSGQGQVRASEPATVSQTIDGTEIAVAYSRPRARGRDSLFGKVVTWEEVWTPGANWATTLEVSKQVRVNGHQLAQGKYSVWMIVRPSAPWTIILDPRHHRFHTNRPDSTAEQVRFDVAPGGGPFTETLSWSFPVVTVKGATLLMQWGTTTVPLDIVVEPKFDLATPSGQSGPYLGTYEFAWADPEPGDTSGSITLTISYRDGSLIGEWSPRPWPEAGPFILIPIHKSWFIPGFMENGTLYEVERDMVFEFALQGRRATSFEVRSEEDKVIAKGKRK